MQHIRRIGSVLVMALALLVEPSLSAQTDDKLRESNPRLWLDKHMYQLVKNVKCLNIMSPFIGASEALTSLYSAASIQEYVRLRLANDLSFIPVCPAQSQGEGAVVMVEIKALERRGIVAVYVETMISFAGTSGIAIASDRWESGDLGMSEKEGYAELIKKLVEGQVEEFARLVVRVRDAWHDDSPTSKP